MEIMAPMDEHRRSQSGHQERRHDARSVLNTRNEHGRLELRQFFDRKAYSNRDSNGPGSNNNKNGNGNSNKNGDSPHDGNGSTGSNHKDHSTTDDGAVASSPHLQHMTTTTAVAISTSENLSTTSSTGLPTYTPPSDLPYSSIPPALGAGVPVTPIPPVITPSPVAYPTLESVSTLSPWSMTPSASQGRKGADPAIPDYPAMSTPSPSPYAQSAYSLPSVSASITNSPGTAIGDLNPAPTQDSSSKHSDNNKHHDMKLSSTAAHVLIALGIIGGLIILISAVYMILRCCGFDVRRKLAQCLGRDTGDDRAGSVNSLKSFKASLHQPLFWKPTTWKPSNMRSSQHDEMDEIPPPYTEAFAPEKGRSTSPNSASKALPITIPTTGTTPLVTNPAPFGASSPIEHNPSAGISYFITNPDRASILSPAQTPQFQPNSQTKLAPADLTRNLSTSSNNATYFGTYNPNVPLTSSHPIGPQDVTDYTRRPSAAFGPNSRLSELSSLSSGFGDAKIDVPESGPTIPIPTQPNNSVHVDASAGNARGRKSSYVRSTSGILGRFSWATTTQGQGKENRDTVYTNSSSSTEERPRFRSVTSWVDQQAGRAGYAPDGNTGVPMPPMPLEPVAKRKPPVSGSAAWQGVGGGGGGGYDGYGQRNSRRESQEGAFNAHPGQEVLVGRGAGRIASSILDGEEGERLGRY